MEEYTSIYDLDYCGSKAMFILAIGQVVLVFSYNTLVAIRTSDMELFTTSFKHSRTTSSHITDAMRKITYHEEYSIAQQALEDKSIKELSKYTKEILLSKILP